MATSAEETYYIAPAEMDGTPTTLHGPDGPIAEFPVVRGKRTRAQAVVDARRTAVVHFARTHNAKLSRVQYSLDRNHMYLRTK